ncbi:MAG: helix-turn-helix domain-containing protein [Natronohydrobacter sp.]|nr:helix-turn-helix domain-containing protein [Natronohydrobacter sp.]
MNRFEWLKAVMQQPDMTPRAKNLATVLAVTFANDDTGQINPGLDTLAEYLGTSVDTVRRAIGDLSQAGWLARTVPHGRGHLTSFTLLTPGKVVALHSVRPASRHAATGTQSSEKRSQPCNLSSGIKGSRPAPKRSQNCNSHIRKEQSLEQKGRAQLRPSPHLHALIEADSDPAQAWDDWLDDHGWPRLADLPALRSNGGFDLPMRWPPTANDTTATMIAEKIATWAISEGARDERAA